MRIGLTTYNRLPLLLISLDSLMKSKFSALQPIILDDCSGQETRDWVTRSPASAHSTKSNRGADRALFQLCDLLYGREPFIVSGSDIIYSRNFDARLLELFAKYKNEKVAMVGAFRGTNHDHSIVNERDDCFEVTSLTGVTLVNPAFWSRCRGLIDKDICDWSMASVAAAQGYKILVVKDSLVQHIGILDGLHLDNPDIGLRFVGAHGQFDYKFELLSDGNELYRWNLEGGPYDQMMLLDSGTALMLKGGEGKGFGPWGISNNTIRVRDCVWTLSLTMNDSIDKCQGMCYPCGTSIVGHHVKGVRV